MNKLVLLVNPTFAKYSETTSSPILADLWHVYINRYLLIFHVDYLVRSPILDPQKTNCSKSRFSIRNIVVHIIPVKIIYFIVVSFNYDVCLSQIIKVKPPTPCVLNTALFWLRTAYDLILALRIAYRLTTYATSLAFRIT